jgi:transcriptional regulator with XRE-family HTH domain
VNELWLRILSYSTKMDQKTGCGERIREERERLGFSQPAFAALAEASKSSQASWEKETAYPNVKALAVWARVGVDVSYVVTGARSSSAATLASDEMELVRLFRAAPLAVKAAAIGALQGGSTGTSQVMQNTGSGSVQIGSIGGSFTSPAGKKRTK